MSCFATIDIAFRYECSEIKKHKRNIQVTTVKIVLSHRVKILQLKCNLLSTILLLAPFILVLENEFAVAQTIDYSVHANIIYHIAKYIDWPADKKSGDFVIGVIGETPLFEELRNATLNKKTGNQNIIIKNFSCTQSAYNCQILFIDDDESGCLKRIVLMTTATPVLIITERPGLALKGSCINFIIVNDKLKLEINKSNIESRKLKIANELLGLGTLIQ